MMRERSEKRTYPPFCPPLKGCVSRDARMARRLLGAYLNEIYAVAANSYHSLLCEGYDQSLSALFEELATDARLLGRLILALGGTPTVRTQLRIGAAPLSDCEDGHDRERWLEETLRHRRGSIELYQTLMGMTEDRIVRSVLVQLLDGEQYAVRRLADAMRKLKKDECCD